MAESTRHRQAFDLYWRLGAGRSIEGLHAALSAQGAAPGLRTLYEWSRTYHWQSRLADLERAARRAEDEARIAAIREMEDRHAKEALLLQQKGAEWLTQLPADDVSADAAIRAIAEGVRLERLVRGQVTERTEHQGETGLERLTDEQVDALLAAAEQPLAGEGATRS